MSKLSQQAYERIQAALWDGRIAAGGTISQGELVRLLDVSLALREAMQVLERKACCGSTRAAASRSSSPSWA